MVRGGTFLTELRVSQSVRVIDPANVVVDRFFQAEELIHRRGCVLRTMGSLQSHFIRLYSSTTLQCTLGYDSSLQCDSFQLGEMIKYFTRKRTLHLQNAFEGNQDMPPYAGALDKLISIFQQCRTYQIDRNHVHCGPRAGIVQALRYVQPSQQAGIRLASWKRNRSGESWLENPAGGKWSLATQMLQSGSESHQACFKTMYVADERDWMPHGL